MKTLAQGLGLGLLFVGCFVVAFFLVELGERASPPDPAALPATPEAFAFVVFALAAVIFAGICYAVRHKNVDAERIEAEDAALAEFEARNPIELDEPILFPQLLWSVYPCPNCSAPMECVGLHSSHSSANLYLWLCENDHGWSRKGATPIDTTQPFEPCHLGEAMEALFG